MSKENKAWHYAEKVAAILCVGAIGVSLLLGYRGYALGVALAAPLAWFFYQWQMKAVDNPDVFSPQKATINLVVRSVLRQLVFFSMAGLSILGGEIFFFGVVTGLLLQIMAFTGQAFFIIIGKEG